MDNASEPHEEGDLHDLIFGGANSDLYRKNGFRILQLATTCSTREIWRRRQTIERSLSNDIPPPIGDGCALLLEPDPVLADIVYATQRVGSPYHRMFDEFFWFWPAHEGDEAMALLAAGSDVGAEKTWLEREDRDESRPVARHNLAVLYHFRAIEAEVQAASGGPTVDAELIKLWDKAFRRWAAVIQDRAAWDFLNERIVVTDDPRLHLRTGRVIREGLPKFLAATTARLAAEAFEEKRSKQATRLITALHCSKFGEASIRDGLNEAAAPILSRLAAMCKAAENGAQSDPLHADKSCQHLISDGTNHLGVIDFLLPPNDLGRQSAHDELAEQILNCQIAFSRKTCSWAPAVGFLEAAVRIVASPSIKTNLEGNLETVRKNVTLADDYCGTGYFDAEPEVLSFLEAARHHVSTKNFEETIRLLTKLLREENDLIQRTGTLPLVRKALAFSLGMRASDSRSRAIAEYNNKCEKYKDRLVDIFTERKARGQIDNYSWMAAQAGLNTGDLYCMVCGASITSSFRIVNHTLTSGEPCKLLVCPMHDSPSTAAVDAAIRASAQDYVDALFLDPANRFIAEQYDLRKKECSSEGISFPTLSPWAKQGVDRIIGGNDSNAAMPTKSRPSAVSPGPSTTKARAAVPARAASPIPARSKPTPAAQSSGKPEAATTEPDVTGLALVRSKLGKFGVQVKRWLGGR